MNVYIVEDEALIVMELSDRLQGLGYEVCGSTARGEQALDSIPALQPDLVLMDIRLAGSIDGIETASRLRERCDVPVVFLTAHADDAHLRRAASVEPFGYLVKPFREPMLNATLRMAYRKARAERALLQANARLAETLVKVRQLEELLPVCMGCKRIRDADGQWQPFETYISSRTGSDFSHAYCPACLEDVMGDLTRGES